jgi:hypothetical protein
MTVIMYIALLVLACAPLPAESARSHAPKVWSDSALSEWAIPVTGVNAKPSFYSEAEYYAAPVDNLRTYPVYHPDREPPNYLESLRKRGPEPMVKPGLARTKEGWIELGRRVWDELDVFQIRTSDFRVVDYVRSREALKKYPARMTKDGQLHDFRWVVDRGGELKLSVRECSSCHSHLMSDGSVITGGQGNIVVKIAPMFGFMFSAFSIPKEPGEELPSQSDTAYASFAVPWLKDDRHEKLKTMSPMEILALTEADEPGTFARFNGSPYYTTKMPSLIGVRYSRYLDHTATHRNRGPEDIARYAALVLFADDGAIGPHKFFTDYQRRLRMRLSDDALYALGMFIYYGLKEPVNPNKLDDVARHGERVFATAGCVSCHTPPNYTNGMLIAADGFTPPDDGESAKLSIMRGVRIGTDPGLALKTRKATGYYKVPTLRGVWHRTYLEHSGSVKSLEEWFDRKRLREDYEPSGWKGPDVKRRAIRGHEFGLDLSVTDKAALIAFLRTL